MKALNGTKFSVNKFMNNLDRVELEELMLRLQTVGKIQHLRLQYGLTREEVSLKLNMSVGQGEKFQKGAVDYTVLDLAKVNDLYNKLREVKMGIELIEKEKDGNNFDTKHVPDGDEV